MGATHGAPVPSMQQQRQHCGQEQACTNNSSSTSASVVIVQACRVRGGVLAKQAHSNSGSVLAE